MRLLAIDTALPAVSACVLDSHEIEPLALESRPMERGHAEAIGPLIQRVVGAVDGGFASLDRVAVTVGPGSFTGVRIGLAAAQAIALARRIELVGVSTLSALAAPSFLEPFEGVIAAAIDARHGQVYVAAFGPDGRMLAPPRRAGVAEALRALGDYPPFGQGGGSTQKLLLVGSGAALLEAQARANGLSARVVSDAPAPDIVFVARLGLVANPDDAPARPLYLKPPDAKPVAFARVVSAPSGAADLAEPEHAFETAPNDASAPVAEEKPNRLEPPSAAINEARPGGDVNESCPS
ncbi:MAG TPA: tRNA (adenosine(37)-N6)-threonylcarbamoyltransferase complex dimerization subunit type 1 TsaB [Methylocystis sp.]|nr:tRNA (adenosine(37)-N6)-threonylcarbamoyltransferase complex dimerization subunit type 1 TsaB [Methylocystis sp.]